MPRFKTAIFDLDGTLLDTSVGILSSVRHAIKECGYDELSDGVIRSFIGPPIQRSFQNVYSLSKEEADIAADVFRNKYKDEHLLEAIPYPGIFDLMANLKEAGVKIAVATYKREDYAVKLLKHFGFDKYSDVLLGSDMEGKLSKSDIIEKALSMTGTTDYKDAVMIGDSDNDAIGAAKLGVPFIGVTYGFGFDTSDDVSAFEAVGSADTTKEVGEIILGV